MANSSAAPRVIHERGAWYQDTKQRRRAEMRSEAMSPAGRLHACLVSHSAPFGRELVARQVGDRLVPLTPRELCDESEIDRRHFGREMRRLKADGLARTEGRAKGQVRIYSCNYPNEHRSASASVQSRSRAERLSPRAVTIQSLFSADVMAWARRLKLQIPDGVALSQADIDQVEKWCEQAREADEKFKGLIAGIVTARGDNVDASDAGIVTARGADCHRAAPPYKEGKKGKKNVVVGLAAATTTETGDDDGIRVGVRLSGDRGRNHAGGMGQTYEQPEGRTDRESEGNSGTAACGHLRGHRESLGGTRTEDNRGTAVGAGTSATTTTVNEHSPAATEQNSAVIDTCPDTVSTAIAEEYSAVDQAHLDNIWRDCRATATPAELAELVRMEAPVVRARQNKPGNGLLRATLVNAARTPAKLAEARRRIAARSAAAAQSPPRMTPEQIADVLNDPDFTESKKRELLGQDYVEPEAT